MSEAQWSGWDRPINERLSGGDFGVTDFLGNLMKGLKDVERPDYSTTKFKFGDYGDTPGFYDSMGNFHPQQGPQHQIQVHWSGGAGGGQSGGAGAAGSSGGGGGMGFGGWGGGTTTGATNAGAGGFWGNVGNWAGNNWQDLARAGLGAYSSYADSRAAQNASRGAGQVDLYSQEDPWGPSVPYRQEGMDRVLAMLRGQGGGAPGQGGVGGGGGGGGGGRGRDQDWWESFKGATGNTDALLEDLRRRGEGGHELYGPANQFTKGLLSGQDPNKYRAETYESLRDYNDPDLRRYKDMLFAGQMPGTAEGGGDPFGRRGGGYRGGGGGGGGGAVGTGPIGIEKYIKDILDEKKLNNNPNLQGVIDASTRDIQRKFMEESVPGVTTQFAGAGRYGSGAWQDALAKAERERATGLSDTIAGVRQGDYESRMADIQNALGLGTQYDMNAINAAAQRASAGAGASASMYATDKESQDRMSLARMNALQDAIAGGMDWEKFRYGGMGDLAGMYSSDQMNALSMVPELSGLDLRDLMGAGQLSIASDQNRGQYGLGMAQLADARRGRNQAMGWQREQYNREEPWKRAMQYSDIINALGGQGGTRHEYGTDQRNVSPYGGSPFGQALQGGLAGWYSGRDEEQRGR